MSVEWFFKLKEIDSLSKMRINYLKHIKEQEDRLSALNKHREDAYLRTSTLKQAHSSLHQNLLETEAQIKNADLQQSRLKDMGGDENKIKTYQQLIEKAEEEGLSLLEQMEHNQQELKETHTFLEGLEKTLLEIKTEVEEEQAKSQAEIKQLETRIELLKNELPHDFKSLLERVSSKNLAMGPFTRIEASSCYFCRYKISRIDESEIDMQKSLKTCPQCGRIFLPYGA